MNSIETILEYLGTQETLPETVKTAIEKVKCSRILTDGYFVHENALDCNYVIGCGDDALDSANGIKHDLDITEDQGGNLGAETLNEWLGL
jgi:hypothetical protein